MSRDDMFLVDILESAKIALDYMAGKTWDQFYEDMQCQDAVLRRIEIIGEAAANVSPAFKSAHAHVEWKKISGTPKPAHPRLFQR